MRKRTISEIWKAPRHVTYCVKPMIEANFFEEKPFLQKHFSASNLLGKTTYKASGCWLATKRLLGKASLWSTVALQGHTYSTVERETQAARLAIYWHHLFDSLLCLKCKQVP